MWAHKKKLSWLSEAPIYRILYCNTLKFCGSFIFDVVFGFATNMCNVTIKRLGKVLIHDSYFESKSYRHVRANINEIITHQILLFE